MKPSHLAGFAVAGALIALCCVCASIAPDYSAGLWWHLRETAWLTVPVIALAFAAAGSRTAWNMNQPGAAGLLAAFAVVGGIYLMWWVGQGHAYQTDRAYYTASAKVTTEQLPELSNRAPFQMATAQVRSNLGDVSGDFDDNSTAYAPRRDEFTTVVARRGYFTGYEAILTQAMTETGNVEPAVCTFDKATAQLRDGGWFGHNLARAINREKFTVRYDPDDVAGYCEEGGPIVVVPLKRQTGFMTVVEKPAGFALYNGKTGKLTFETDAAKLRIPVATYPLSIAGRQRDALQAPGGYSNWRANRGGYETDPEDTNSGNNTEFTLGVGEQHEAVYITPLTGRGKATALSAVAVVDAVARPGGKLAPIVVHRNSPVWRSTKALESRIKDDYQDLPNWQNVRVFEIAPAGPNKWVATLGLRDGNTIAYRIRGTGDLKGPNATCLYRADNQKIRCGRVYANVPDEQVPVAPGGPAPDPVLRTFNDQQLVEELARRLAEK